MIPVLRSSSLDRDLECNGAITLVPLVDPRSGDEGDEGQFLHWLAHSKMKLEMGASGDAGPAIAVPKSASFSAWISEFYLSFAREVYPPDWSLEVEAAVSYEFNGFILSGHLDSVAISPDGTRAVAIDLKTGYVPVDPVDCNEQIFSYACLLLRAYPTLTEITFYIVQPRNDEDEGFRRISEPLVISGDRLANCIPTLERRVNAAIANRFEVNTGMKQCRFCPAAPQCPAATALRDLMKATLTPEYLATLKATPDDAALADWVIAGRTLNRPIEDAEKMLKARIKEQGFVDAGQGVRITIKEEGGAYSFPDPLGFYHATRRLIPDDAKYAETVKPSVTKTKEAIAAVTGLPKASKVGESAASVFDEQLKPLVVQGVRERMVFQ